MFPLNNKMMGLFTAVSLVEHGVGHHGGEQKTHDAREALNSRERGALGAREH
jgi:hypothetical protein